MSDPESRREDAKREAYEDRMESLPRPEECCVCCLHRAEQLLTECDKGASWDLAETTVYGDDADGRRGVPLYLYVCSRCGDEREVLAR